MMMLILLDVAHFLEEDDVLKIKDIWKAFLVLVDSEELGFKVMAAFLVDKKDVLSFVFGYFSWN
jgi:hypothetical protein